MIYLIANRQNHTCKIGFSENPQKRIHDLQVANSVELELLATMEGDKKDEKSLHIKFDLHRVNGEWFNLSDEILDYFNVDFSIKCYESFLNAPIQLNGSSLKVLYYCIFNCQINSNIIKLDKNELIKINNVTGVSVSSIKNSISIMKKKKFLISKGNAIYRCNPTNTWKGSDSKRLKTMKYVLEIECHDCL